MVRETTMEAHIGGGDAQVRRAEGRAASGSGSGPLRRARWRGVMQPGAAAAAAAAAPALH